MGKRHPAHSLAPLVLLLACHHTDIAGTEVSDDGGTHGPGPTGGSGGAGSGGSKGGGGTGASTDAGFTFNVPDASPAAPGVDAAVDDGAGYGDRLRESEYGQIGDFSWAQLVAEVEAC